MLLKYKVRIWDLPTRLFHWGLAVCFTGLLVSGLTGGDAMDWHFRFGFSALSLLLFRLVWGFIGGHWSRFSTFLVGPGTIWRYLHRHGTVQKSVGHNPLGSLSVSAMFVFLLLQIIAGLFSDDEISTSGPLAKMAASVWVDRATHYHTTVGKYILIGLVLLHLGALTFYRLCKNEKLVAAMVVGDKDLDEAFESARDDTRSRLLAAIVFAVCSSFVVGFVRWAN
jgi:cytochrome b